tara:strand:- start:9082 stop:11166 length:2085 start_codon:yes stop_codon:yes gene_type:complete
MAILLQSDNSFAKYLVWCGVCTDDSDTEYDLTTTDKILQVTEYSASGLLLRVYDTSVFESFWDFSKLRIGHAYHITLRKGSGQVEIPNIAVSFSESNSISKITTTCGAIAPTPTPTPKLVLNTPTPKDLVDEPFDCCSDMRSVTLNNDADGVSLQVVDDKFTGGKLCYSLKDESVPVVSGQSESFYAKTNLGDFIANIVISSKEGLNSYKGFDDSSSGRFVYKMPNGDCYEGDFEWATPNDYTKGPIMTKIEAESVIEFNEELLSTPTSARYYLPEETPSPEGSGLNPNINFNSDDYTSTILSAGTNEYGQLASEFSGVGFYPSYIPSYSLFSASKNHFLYLKSDGTLHGGGLALDGQLGNSPRLNTTNSSENTSEQIMDENLESIRDIYTTNSCSFVIKSDDTLWGFGKNESGELGTDNELGFSTAYAKKISLDDVYAFIRPSNAPTDFSVTYVRTNSGEVYGCGYNLNNNFLLGTSNSNYLGMVKMPIEDSELVSISLTSTSTFLLKTDGRIYVTGDVGTNGNGGIGLTEQNNKTDLVRLENCVSNDQLLPFEDITQIHTNGKDALVALRADGKVFTWGIGEEILGIGNPNDYSDGYSITHSSEPSLRGRSIPTQVNISDVKYVSMSSNCCFAVKTDGTLWTWGTPSNNENGLYDSDTRFQPTLVELDTFLEVRVESIISTSINNFIRLEYT